MLHIIKCPDVDISKGAHSVPTFTFCVLTNTEDYHLGNYSTSVYYRSPISLY